MSIKRRTRREAMRGMTMIANGKGKVAQPTQAQTTLPFVQVIADPARITPENPNGVGVLTNMTKEGKPADMAVIQILSEAIRIVAGRVEQGGTGNTAQKLSANIVMPDGRAAPLPPDSMTAPEQPTEQQKAE